MDKEDREHFKTIASQPAKPQTDSLPPQNEGNSQSLLDQAFYLQKAKAIFGCYRRDEAHDPDMFVAGLTAVLGDYPAAIVDYVADPRTGVLSEFPMGLPNVGQIRQLCDTVARRMEVLARPRALAAPYVPPPIPRGRISYSEHIELSKAGKTKPRPIGRFERPGDEWNRLVPE